LGQAQQKEKNLWAQAQESQRKEMRKKGGGSCWEGTRIKTEDAADLRLNDRGKKRRQKGGGVHWFWEKGGGGGAGRKYKHAIKRKKKEKTTDEGESVEGGNILTGPGGGTVRTNYDVR